MPDPTTDTTAAPSLGPSTVRERLRELADRPRLAEARKIAEAIGLPVQTIWTLARKGRLPSISFGRMRRFDAAAVASFLASGGTPFEGEEADEAEAES